MRGRSPASSTAYDTSGNTMAALTWRTATREASRSQEPWEAGGADEGDLTGVVAE